MLLLGFQLVDVQYKVMNWYVGSYGKVRPKLHLFYLACVIFTAEISYYTCT